jgi:hypothetical protein
MPLMSRYNQLLRSEVVDGRPNRLGPVGFSDGHNRSISHVVGVMGGDGITRVAGRWGDGYLRQFRPQFRVVQQKQSALGEQGLDAAIPMGLTHPAVGTARPRDFLAGDAPLGQFFHHGLLGRLVGNHTGSPRPWPSPWRSPWRR